MDIFVQRMRQAMFLRGIKQVDLSKSTGFSDGQISSWYNGKYRPNAAAMARLAVVLHVTPAWLTGQEELKAADIMPKPEEARNAEERELLEKWREAPEQIRRLVVYALNMKDGS